MDPRPLAAGFSEPSIEAWRALVAKLVPGGEPALRRKTYDGIELPPLHRPGDVELEDERPGLPPFTRGARPLAQEGGWDIRQRVAHPDPIIANRQIKEEVAGGATSVLLRTDESLGLGEAAADGIALYDRSAVEALLDGLDLERVPIHLDAGWRYAAVAALFIAAWQRRGLPLERFAVPVGADPIGAAIRGIPTDLDAALARAVEVTLWFERRGLQPGTLLADGHHYHAGGSSSAHELGCALATATAYLRALDRADLPPDRGVLRIAFRLAVDADIFTSIAKLRAIRRLWHRVTEACGTSAEGMQVEAVTGRRMLAARDVPVNLLRTTAAAFAGAVGGADAITVLPFDYALGLPTADARRLARNIQHVLRHESGLALVADPAGGSGHVEAATRALAREAWGIFQLIESGGGMVPMLLRGSIQDWVGTTWATREANIARRRDPLTGISEFPDLGEVRPVPEPFDQAPLVASVRARLEDAAGVRGQSFEALIDAAAGGRALHYQGPVASYTAILPCRLGQGFEALRDRSDAHEAARGQRPRVCLVELGSAAQSDARTAFARNLFAAGGIEAVVTGRLRDAADVAAAWRGCGTPLAALCSSDEVYGELALAAVAALVEAGAARVWLMGRPRALLAALEAVGLTASIAAGDDLLAILNDAYSALDEVP